LTAIRFVELGATAFKNASANLTKGLWVILAYRDDAAEEFTRIVAGVDKPLKGRLWIEGRAPRSCPAVRRHIDSTLPQESLDFANTVEDLVTWVGRIRGLDQSPANILSRLSLEHWSRRPVATLSQRESRQLTLALALAQPTTSALVIHEPLLALNNSQVPQFQESIANLASRACVVCVTSSLHDARALGGPHAQLTALGWEPSNASNVSTSSARVHLEGKNLRELTSRIALKWPLGQLELQSTSRGNVLQVTGRASDVSTGKVAIDAREIGVSIRRLWSETIGPQQLEVEPIALPVETEPSGLTARHSPIAASITLDAVKRGIRGIRRAATKPMNLAALLLGPGLAMAYAGLLRVRSASWANYDTLVFIGTVLTPLWSLWLCRLMWAGSTRQEAVEIIGRFGVDRRALAIGRTLTISFIAGLLGAASALAAILYASSGRANPPAISELYQSTWIIGFAGVVYGAIAASLSNVKRPWLSRWAFILLDFALGGGSSSVSVPFPRAHIHNLLGSPSSVAISQPSSCAYLGLLLLLAIGLTSITTEP
jgi:ABC-type transport system involved in cytochrome c biogenesis ATPase subunit